MTITSLRGWFGVACVCVCVGAGGGASARAESVVAPGAKPVKISNEFTFTEGPSADQAGNVFFTDQPNDRIKEYSVDGKISEWMKPAGRANGTRFDPAGNLIACADEHNQLWSISPDKHVTVLVTGYAGRLLNGPNDVWVLPNGDLYFTDPLYVRDYWKRDPKSQQPGRYVYFRDHRNGAVRIADRDYKQPNGITGTPDGKTLYVSDIGAGKTYVYQVGADGTLNGRKLFCSMGSDGMTMDAEGDVYLTGKGVTVFNSQGQKIDHIEIDEPWTANLTFCGPDRDRLFMAASTAVYVVKMRVHGAR
jgi:gluconolactonase